MDSCSWAFTHDGAFSVASAYEVMRGPLMPQQHGNWDVIWKLPVPERVRSFLWLVQHGRLITNQRKNRLGLGDPYCDRCGTITETVLHALRDCPHAKFVWTHLVKYCKRASFFFGDLHQWISLNLREDFGWVSNSSWRATWRITCSLLWTWRNKESHDNI